MTNRPTLLSAPLRLHADGITPGRDRDPVTEYRIDELAQAAGTTVRNVRVYQERGLLDAPRKEGRTGWYSEAHLARLRLIGRLLERGYTFATIRELLAAWQRGWKVEDVLGLEDAVSQPWTDERPERITLTELRRVFGKQATPGALERACQAGLLTVEGKGFIVQSPALLAAGADLVASGIPLTDVLDLAEAVQSDLAVVARRFVEQLESHVVPAEGLPDIAEATRLIQQLRPHALRAVDAVFAAAMDKEVGRAVLRAARRIDASGPRVAETG